jgi:hypothetical protein
MALRRCRIAIVNNGKVGVGARTKRAAPANDDRSATERPVSGILIQINVMP